MGSVDAGVIAGAGRVRYRTTVHGPVTGYATAGGKRIAIARKRASFGRDVLWQLPFRDATIGRITGTRSFVRAFARSPFTFNVGYADDRDIAMFSAGELPRRDPRVDPRLPTLGTGALRVAGHAARPQAAAAGQPAERRARELEQQPRARLRRGGRQLVLRLAAPRLAAPGPDRAPRQARPRVGDERDERRGDAGPALDRADADALEPAAQRAGAERPRRSACSSCSRPGAPRARAGSTATRTARWTPAPRR